MDGTTARTRSASLAERSLPALALLLLLLGPAREARAAPPAQAAAYPTGVAPMSDAAFLAIQEVRMVRRFTDLSGKPSVSLPAAVDLSPEFPPVGEQKDPTCPGWAFAYAIKSFHEKVEHGWAYGDNHLFSPTFLTTLLGGGSGLGARNDSALLFSIDVGAVPLSLHPYVPDDETRPAEELIRLARAFRALSFRRLPEGDLHTLKAVLAGGDPVACAIHCHDEFFALSRRSPVLREMPKGPARAAHYLVIVGYDDARRAIKFYNSWGTGWGENGCGWVDYDLYGRFVFHPVVVYDRPTPPEVVAWLADPHRRPAGPPPEFAMADLALRKALSPDESAETLIETARNMAEWEPPKDGQPPEYRPAPAGEPLLVVPEEAGVAVGGNWLRLEDPLDRSTSFFSEKVSPRFAGFKPSGDGATVTRSFMDATAVGRIDLSGAGRGRVVTSRGVALGDPKAKARRIYRAPDLVSDGGATETWFFKSVAKDWGGVKAVLSAALEFRYGASGKIARISLFTAHPDAYAGRALKPVDAKEVVRKAASGDTVDSPEGNLSFVAPDAFSRCDKSVWPGVGVGYFLKGHVTKETWMVAVKVFHVAGASRERLLSERIPADGRTYAMMKLKPPAPRMAGDTEWLVVADAAGAFANAYTWKTDRYVQVTFATDTPVMDEPWTQAFLESFVFE